MGCEITIQDSRVVKQLLFCNWVFKFVTSTVFHMVFVGLIRMVNQKPLVHELISFTLSVLFNYVPFEFVR